VTWVWTSEIARVENDEQKVKDGQCRTGHRRTGSLQTGRRLPIRCPVFTASQNRVLPHGAKVKAMHGATRLYNSRLWLHL